MNFTEKTLRYLDMRNKLLQQCEASYKRYEKSVRDVSPRNGCMLKAENFCFCCMCELYSVDVIIETGVFFGASTEMFARYFEGSETEIHAIDISWPDGLQEKLQSYKNIKETYCADGTQKILELITKFKDKKIAVFIDGPKGEQQLSLAKKIINSVEFVALHDVGREYCMYTAEPQVEVETHDNFVEWDRSMFITTEDWFANKYSHMNIEQLRWLQKKDTRWEKRNDGYDESLWNPILDKITPNGFGLGIAMKAT